MLSFLVATASIVVTIAGCIFVYLDRHDKNFRWFLGLVIAIGGSFSTIGTIVLDSETDEAIRTAINRSQIAEHKADESKNALAETAIGELNTEQYDKLLAACRSLRDHTGGKLHVEFIAPETPRLSSQYADVLRQAFNLSELGGNKESVLNAWHKGVWVYGSARSQNTQSVIDALTNAGIDASLATDPLPDAAVINMGTIKTTKELIALLESTYREMEIVFISVGTLK